VEVVISAVSIVPAVVPSSERTLSSVWLVSSDRFRNLGGGCGRRVLLVVWWWLWLEAGVFGFLEKEKKLRLGFFTGVASLVVWLLNCLRDFGFLLLLVDQEKEEAVVDWGVVLLRLNKEDLDFVLGLVMVGKPVMSLVGRRLELESILE